MVHGTFFPFLWQPPRPNLITYNFISTHGQHKRSNLRSGQPTVLRVQSPLFGVRLSVPASRTHSNTIDNRLPIPMPIDLGNQNVFGSVPFGRGGQYDVPFDALAANDFRPPIFAAQPSDFLFRTPLNIPPTRPARPELPPNFLISPNILLRPQSSSPRPFPSPRLPPNFLIPPGIFIRPQPSPPRPYTPFNIPYPFSFRLL